MPSSKEVRARQNRQKERVALQHAERRRVQKRRRQVGGITGVIVLVIVVVVGLAAGGKSGSKVVVSAPPSSTDTLAPPTTTTAKTTQIPQPPEKPCVGLKDALPKGSPPMLLAPGPAPTKLTTQDLQVGTGAVVPPNSKVTVNYVGVSCSTGKIFDSSYSRNQTFAADLSGGVIAGWIQGIPGMKIGGIRLLAIPSSLGYGAAGQPPAIAKNEALYFLVAAVKLG
jgi:peptidylprolyl isomerase